MKYTNTNYTRSDSTLNLSECWLELMRQENVAGSWHYDIDSDHVYLCDKSIEILGLPLCEGMVPVKDVLAKIQDDQRESVKARLLDSFSEFGDDCSSTFNIQDSSDDFCCEASIRWKVHYDGFSGIKKAVGVLLIRYSSKKSLENIGLGKKYFSDLFDKTSDGICVFSRSLKILDINHAGIKQLGISEEEIKKSSLLDVIGGSDPQKTFQFMLLAEQSDVVQELEFVRSNEETTYLEVSISHLGNDTFAMITRDITKRKLKENKEEVESEAVFRQGRLLAELALNLEVETNEHSRNYELIISMLANEIECERASIWFFDGDDGDLICNTMFNRSLNKFKSGSVLRFKDYPEFLSEIHRQNNIVAHDALSHPYTTELVDSYLIPKNISSLLDVCLIKDGCVVGLLSVGHVGPKRYWATHEQSFVQTVAALVVQVMYSIERNQTKSSLNALQKNSMHLIESMIEGVLVSDETGAIVNVNQASCDLFGYSSEELSLCNIDSIFAESIDDIRRGSTTSGTEQSNPKAIGINKEVVGLTKDGRHLPMQLSFSELPGSKLGTRFLTVCRDLSREKEQEQQAHQAQKMDALGKLTGGVAHDFNNILGVIMGYSEMIEQASEGNLKLYASELLKAGSRAVDLTSRLLSFSSKHQGQPKIVNINRLIDDGRIIIEKALMMKVELRLIFEPKLWQTKLDPNEFQNALLNLCINAMHAMQNGGLLKVTTNNRDVSVAQAKIYNVDPGQYVEVSIEDNGIGMSFETKQKIFEPFFTTKGDKGCGLGLPQVYGLLNRVGGFIKVESQLNAGSSFMLYFPREKKLPQHTNPVNYPQGCAEGKETILLVDDEQQIRAVLQSGLSALGYTVIVAENGVHALAVLEREHIDLVLTDILMPEMDGLELTKIISERYPKMSVQLMSGYSEAESSKDVPELLYQSRLQKPFSIKVLSDRIRRLLDSGSIVGRTF